MKKKIISVLSQDPELKQITDKVDNALNAVIAKVNMHKSMVQQLVSESEKDSKVFWTDIENILKNRELIDKNYSPSKDGYLQLDSELGVLVLCTKEESDNAHPLDEILNSLKSM